MCKDTSGKGCYPRYTMYFKNSTRRVVNNPQRPSTQCRIYKQYCAVVIKLTKTLNT